jgi:hypothetical protein
MTGYGKTEEVQTGAALHAVRHGTLGLEECLLTFGARCPGENELMSGVALLVDNAMCVKLDT